MASGHLTERLTPEEWLKKKQLDEARKAGTAPAEVDEDGHEINPHIPLYISQAPWYFGSRGPSLKHQHKVTSGTEDAPLDPVVPRGLVRSVTATHYRKGACTNCGSMTHTAKECCERPRAVGARYSNANIMPDEVVVPKPAPGSESYDAKRDRWAGYDPARHAALTDFYNKVEQARRAKRAQSSSSSGQEDGKEGFVQGRDFNDAPIQQMDGNGRSTVRTLRIREDTAKYLRNLDLNSAYYDPKTRSMRDNPNPDGGNPADLPFAGDNFTRVTGDAIRFAEEQLFSYDAAERGEDTNMIAAPSQVELLHKKYKQEKEAREREKRQLLLEKYGTGDASYVGGQQESSGDAITKQEDETKKKITAIFSQSEEYVEYGKDGRVIGGNIAERGVKRSKWEEDVFTNNHTSVWGSWWHDGKWGYACCHSLIKNSICTGEAGKKALELSAVPSKKESASSNRSPHAATVAAKEEEKEVSDFIAKKRRKYNSGSAQDDVVTEEQYEEYQRTRIHGDDPMKAFLE